MSLTGIIFFGDSILAGTGASERDKCCAKLVKAASNVPVSLKGRNWNTSEDGLARLAADVLSQSHLSHVIILFGNNDSWPDEYGKPKIGPQHLRRNISEIIDRIRNNKQLPLLCNLQPIDPTKISISGKNLSPSAAAAIQESYSKTIEAIASELRVKLIDIRSKLIETGSAAIASDGLHPNDSGHKIIADCILSALKTLP